MGRRVLVALACAGLLAPPVAAQTQGGEVATPDDRVRVGVEGGMTGPDSGFVRAHGHVGAYHFDNTLAGSPEGFRVTNPPMYGAHGSDGPEFEELYGPPVANAALGTGALTAGFKATGVLTNLAWPGPGFYDHVNYLHRTRGWTNGGAPENAGSFAGLLLDGSVTWFTEVEGWRPAEPQAYEGDESGVLRTVLTNPAFPGVEVVLRDAVHPELDVLARSITVDGAPAGSRLAYYGNFSPTTARAPKAPSITDALLDEQSDFATLYDDDVGAMLHFRPYRLDPAAATAAATGQLGPEAAARAIERTIGADGVYVAVAGDDAPAQHQAGLEAAGLLRQEAEGTPLLDPYDDAADGAFSGSPGAVGKTAGAQAWSGTSGTVYVAAAGTDAEVRELVGKARRLGFDGVRAAADTDWAQWLEGVRLPSVADARTEAVAKRALMLIRTAQDRRTGAIVANTTTQTPYRQDWLRDGAFFNYALLLAGTETTLDMVEHHNDFYRGAQTETGHWDPILCTDGAHCDAVFPFEIDAQAFGVWALWMEYEFSGDAARLETNYEAIRKGTEILYLCHDPTNDLQCYASEDDHPDPTQGPQGASTVYLGLRSGAAAAELMGDTENADKWAERADALKAAATEAFCEETCRTGRGYMIWPGRVLEPGDAHTEATLDDVAETLTKRMTFQAPQPGGFFQYPMEPMFGLAVAWQSPGAEGLLADGIRWLTHDVAAPGVLHYGERIYYLGDETYLHSVGFPHIWSGTEAYIAAALVHGAGGCSADDADDGATCPVPGTPAAFGDGLAGAGDGSTGAAGDLDVAGESARSLDVPGPLAATGAGLLGLMSLGLLAAGLLSREAGASPSWRRASP